MLGPFEQLSHLRNMGNDAMSAFARENERASQAAQDDADRQHQQAMQQQRLNAQMQMQQQERQGQREKYGLLSGLIGKATGTSGFHVDGRGNYSRT